MEEMEVMEGTQHGNKRSAHLGVTTRKQRKLQTQAERDAINFARRQARANLSQTEEDAINFARRQARANLSQTEEDAINLARRQARANLSQADREAINLAQQQARANLSQAERDAINLAQQQARANLSQAERNAINLAQQQARANLSQTEEDAINLARRQARTNLSQAERDAINLAQRQSQQQQAVLRQPDFELRHTNTYIRRPDALLTTQERENNAIISQERREAAEALRRLSPRSQEEIEETGRLQRNHNLRRRNIIPTECIAKSASIDDFNERNVPEYSCGNMTEICGDCQARFWPKERNTQKKYTTCCNNGKIKLQPMQEPPAFAKELLLGQTRTAKIFYANARYINTNCSFAAVTLDTDQFSTHGVPAIRMSGSIYHRLGAVSPIEGQSPKFMQCFFHDTSENNDILDPHQRIICSRLIEEAKRFNSFFLTLKENMHRIDNSNTELPRYRLVLSDDPPPNTATRTYNRPTSCEVSAILTGDGEDTPGKREVQIYNISNDIQYVNDNHTSYDPLAYVISHMHGEPGWTYDIPKYKFNNLEKVWELAPPGRCSTVSTMDYYAYRLHSRDPRWVTNDPSTHNIVQDAVLYGGLLAHQYFCDQWVKTESQRMKWVKFNQKKLKSELYSGLADAVAANDARAAGTFTVLPSSVLGSPRYMQAKYQDAMAMVRRLGKPTYFITFTCNPNWQEILDELRPGEQSWMRPDITNRVYHMKLKEFMNDLTKNNVLGKAIGHTMIIEFQKRGLPHAHILLIVQPSDRPQTTDDYDHIVCAEIPDPVKHPRLHRIITTNNLHGPCGVRNPNCVCMDQGRKVCTAHFPKELREFTTNTENSFPEYRRRNLFPYEKLTSNQMPGTGILFDDSWVVPYSPFLSLKYNAHINVEICTSVKCVKYIFKYVTKGIDKASVQIQPKQTRPGHAIQPGHVAPVFDPTAAIDIDEVKDYIDARYVGACEAVWRIYSYDMSDQYPNIVRLQLHEEGKHMVQFLEGDEANVVQNSEDAKSTLTKYFEQVWFEYNTPLQPDELGEDCFGVPYPAATDLTYDQFPSFYTWEATKKCWKRRTKPNHSDAIGRIYAAHPNSGEKFYLRLLLITVKGAHSYANLRTVDGEEYGTFKEACFHRNLLADDSEWKACLFEACNNVPAAGLRSLFVHILFFNRPVQPASIWDMETLENRTFKDEMCSDFAFHRARESNMRHLPISQVDYDACLYDIEDQLREVSNGTLSLADCQLPTPSAPRPQHVQINEAMRDEQSYNREECLAMWQPMLQSMNEDQKAKFQRFNRAIANRNNVQELKIFFLDAPGGTGKTYIFNALLCKWRAENLIICAIATSGIAAILLIGGRTAHSRFGIPLIANDGSQSSVKMRSNVAKMLRECSAFIWDEAPMCSKNAIKVVDKLLQNIMQSDLPFGGKIFIFGGDFRQVLPVVPRQGRAGITSQILKKLSWWGTVETLSLTINERVKRHADNEEGKHFSAFLLQIGEGKIPYHPDIGKDMIKVPDHYVFQSQNPLDFINWCYPNLSLANPNVAGKAILAPTNKEVDFLNNKALDLMQGSAIELKSSDELQPDDPQEHFLFPVEFLNTIVPPGMPPHMLCVKVGAPAILLRNIDAKRGLCNGTRLTIRNVTHRLLTVEIMNGSHQGQVAYLPRMDLLNAEGTYPFTFKRRQFPIKLAFAMTINKAQGQSLEHVGVYLPAPVFAHGQLYVALSRSGVPANTKLLIINVPGVQGVFPNKEGIYTRNVVFNEVFRD